MSIVAVLLVQPNAPDQLIAYPGLASFDAIYAAVRRKLGPKPFRLLPLDVGAYEVGDDNPRPADELPVSESAIHRDMGRAIELQSRSLWKVCRPGRPERLELCAADMSEQDLADSGLIARLGEATVMAAEPGVYPIRRVLNAYRGDGRSLDEKGYFQLAVPSLPSIE